MTLIKILLALNLLFIFLRIAATVCKENKTSELDDLRERLDLIEQQQQELKGRLLVVETVGVVLRNKFEHVEDCLAAVLIERHVDKEVLQ